uniref:Uncharacterized protein n=1 Tax=Populus trichocarpa TaxID=3694 RepID=A0A3N7HH62_POPTR
MTLQLVLKQFTACEKKGVLTPFHLKLDSFSALVRSAETSSGVRCCLQCFFFQVCVCPFSFRFGSYIFLSLRQESFLTSGQPITLF